MHSQQPSVHHADTPSTPRHSATARIVGRVALIAVLGLAFMGYLTPDMRIQWANLMTLCGF